MASRLLTNGAVLYEGEWEDMPRRAGQLEYLRISEVASILGVSPSSLRNWEQRGLFTAERTKSRYRLYSRETVRRLQKITHLRRINGVNPAGIRQLWHERGESADVSVPLALGPLLERRRTERNLSIGCVAQNCGISPRQLAAIERGETLPTIAGLRYLTTALGLNVESLLPKTPLLKKLVRPRERQVVRAGPGVQIELIAPAARQLQAHIFRIEPRGTSGGSYQHHGEELLYVLHGKLELWLDEIERYVLMSGDSLLFKSDQPHRWRSLSDEECVVLWVNTPQTF